MNRSLEKICGSVLVTFLLLASVQHAIGQSHETIPERISRSQGKVEFRVRFSKLYATYDFLTRVADGYPENPLKKILSDSKYNTKPFLLQVAEFEKLRLDYSYAFDQFPAFLKTGMMSRDLLERNLVLSDDISDFRDRSMGILPVADLDRLCEILANFIPIYDQLVFQPNRSAFLLQRDKLLKAARDGKFNTYFAKGLSFYGTSWQPEMPFYLCLLPSLEKNAFGARAFINVAVCEVPIGLKDHEALFSVAMHEIYHIVYDGQPLLRKQQTLEWFNATGSTNSQYALLLLNEVLATALGNGYVTQMLKGEIKEDDWYDNPYITAMAKKIYPMVASYVESGRTMDEAFAKAYVMAYDTHFQHWSVELDHLMAYRYVLADDQDDLRYFRKTYRKYSLHRSGSSIDAVSIEKMAEATMTKVVVISSDHKRLLALIEDYFPEVKLAKLDFRGEFASSFRLADRTVLLVVNRHGSSAAQLMEQFFPGQMIR
jgi:hypothetical protein